jgi:hypothetical protein
MHVMSETGMELEARGRQWLTILNSLVCDFEENPLLDIGRVGFSRRHRKELRVKCGDVLCEKVCSLEVELRRRLSVVLLLAC